MFPGDTVVIVHESRRIMAVDLEVRSSSTMSSFSGHFRPQLLLYSISGWTLYYCKLLAPSSVAIRYRPDKAGATPLGVNRMQLLHMCVETALLFEWRCSATFDPALVRSRLAVVCFNTEQYLVAAVTKVQSRTLEKTSILSPLF